MQDCNTIAGAIAPSVGLGAELIGSVTRWCEFSQGQIEAAQFLSSIANSTGVGAVSLGRIPHVGSHATDCVTHDKRASSIGVPHVDRVFAREVLGDLAATASPGTVWFGSMMPRGASPALEALQYRRGWTDIAILPLNQDRNRIDVLEFHFDGNANNKYLALFNMLAGPFAQTWSSRTEGVFAKAVGAQKKKTTSGAVSLIPLLSYENPCRLSKAEFRVCLLLSQGCSNERVMQELQISQATLRTHLRNIYAKTGALGHSDLIYKLLNFAPSAIEARRAMGRSA